VTSVAGRSRAARASTLLDGGALPHCSRSKAANIGFQLGGQATDFVLLVMNPKGAESILSKQGEARGRRFCRRRPQGAHSSSGH